jgi:hypothetical protein
MSSKFPEGLEGKVFLVWDFDPRWGRTQKRTANLCGFAWGTKTHKNIFVGRKKEVIHTTRIKTKQKQKEKDEQQRR